MNLRRTRAAHAESAPDPTHPLPPIDLAAPAQFETATFALG
jgi:hypothetical protein